MGVVISFVNQKGGVGKSTSVISVGGVLASQGFKVGIIDFDPQGTISKIFFGDKGMGRNPTSYEALKGMFTEKMVGEKRKNVPLPFYEVKQNLDICPSSIMLFNFDTETGAKQQREYILQDKIKLDKIKEKYDFVLIDCPPSLTFMMINAIVASDYGVIPVESTYPNALGTRMLVDKVESLKRLNPKFNMLGAFITRQKGNTRVSKSILAKLEKLIPIFDTRIRESKDLQECLTPLSTTPLGINGTPVGMDIMEYAPESKSAIDYTGLTNEILSHLKETRNG